MWTIIILIILLAFSLVILPFCRQLILDKDELKQTTIEDKFRVLVANINAGLMDGKGEVTVFEDNPKLMNLFSDEKANMIIRFFYGTGHLTIELGYKYFQKEVTHKKTYYNLRNITIFQQKDIANDFLFEAKQKIVQHEQTVLNGTTNTSYSHNPYIQEEDDPINLIHSLYKDLSAEQKYSIINFYYTIAVIGNKDLRIGNDTNFQKMLLNIGVTAEACERQMAQYGESKIINDLQGVDRSIISLMMAGSIMFIKHSVHSIEELRTQKMFSLFAQLGYTEDDIVNEIQKIMALNKLFFK